MLPTTIEEIYLFQHLFRGCEIYCGRDTPVKLSSIERGSVAGWYLFQFTDGSGLALNTWDESWMVLRHPNAGILLREANTGDELLIHLPKFERSEKKRAAVLDTKKKKS